MKITLDIDLQNTEALALIEYIRSLQFVKIDEKLGSIELTADQKKAIDQGIKSLDSESLTHEQVMRSTKERFPHLFDKKI